MPHWTIITASTPGIMSSSRFRMPRWCQQGKDGEDAQEPPNWTQDTRQEIKRHVGHRAGNRRRGETVGRQHSDDESRPFPDMGTWEMRVTLHRVPMHLNEDRLGTFFSTSRQFVDVLSILNKAGIATGDFFFQVTMTRKNSLDILDTLTCRDRTILVVVASWGTCLRRAPVRIRCHNRIQYHRRKQWSQKSYQSPDGLSEWEVVGRKTSKVVTPPPWQDVPYAKKQQQQQQHQQKQKQSQQEQVK